VLANLDGEPDPHATLPPWTPLKKIPRSGEAPATVRNPPATAAPSRPPATAAAPATLEALLAEVQAVRRAQDEILALLQSRGSRESASPNFAELEDDEPRPAPVVRSRRRKSVLLIDDDPASRDATAAALEKADVPVRTAEDGSAGIAAIAAERPDVIVLELDVAGGMAGKDVINMIKATMEWVDIPIVLHTRAPIASQKEARTIHGADDFVLKQPGSPEFVVSRVIGLFRKG
jgi:CheY-like chemotaxis protein